MKKVRAIIIVIIVLVAFSGCGQVSSLSGKYINEQDKSEYLKFSGESTVKLHIEDMDYTGTYSILDNAVFLTFGQGDDTGIVVLEIKKKDVLLSLNGLAYVKKTFWNHYWKIYLFISVVIEIIYFLFKKIIIEHKGVKDIIKDIEDEVA